MNHLSIYLFFCVFFVTFHAKAQDTLKLKDGTTQLVKIIEINESSIKYKKSDFPNGPSYLILISDVKSVTYLNGVKEQFNKSTPPNNENRYKEEGTLPNYMVKDPIDPSAQKKSYQKKSGPRIGCTYVGEGTAADWITDQGKVPFVSQIGWEFETRFFSAESGVAGMLECTVLLAGIEQGMILPNGSLLIGIRGREGLELAMGPNLSLSGLGMEFSVGNTLQLGDVYFPVNLSFVPSVSKSETTYTGSKVSTQTGFRVSLLIGFYSKKK